MWSSENWRVLRGNYYSCKVHKLRGWTEKADFQRELAFFFSEILSIFPMRKRFRRRNFVKGDYRAEDGRSVLT